MGGVAAVVRCRGLGRANEKCGRNWQALLYSEGRGAWGLGGADGRTASVCENVGIPAVNGL